jgi:hypothetical protein
MTQTIIDSADVAEIDGYEEGEEIADLSATKEAAADTMDFHVQMRSYTMRDFESLVIHAAAQQLLSGRDFKSGIQARAIEIANEKMNAQLMDTLGDVMKITVSMRGNEVVTLGQMIGMEAKDYLTTQVKSDGTQGSGYYDKTEPRIAWLVGQYVKKHFASEIKAAMDGVVADVRAAISAQIDKTISAERSRMADALGFEIKKPR